MTKQDITKQIKALVKKGNPTTDLGKVACKVKVDFVEKHAHGFRMNFEGGCAAFDLGGNGVDFHAPGRFSLLQFFPAPQGTRLT